MSYYSDSPDILSKYEFRNKPPVNFVYQTPRQILLKNFISLNTIYDNILLFHSLGTGKTCTAISIAEGFKEYLTDMNRSIIIFTKNTNIEKNFKNEILSKCTGNEYLNDAEDEDSSPAKLIRKIHKTYKFITYGTFTNKVNSGKWDYNFNNSVIIIDEVHNVTNNDVYLSLKKVLEKCYNYRLVLLTATPVYDNPREIIEISNLLNLNDDKNILPIRGEAFRGETPILYKTKGDKKNRLIRTPVIELTKYGEDMLRKTLSGKVSYLTIDPTSHPEKIEMGEYIDKNSHLKIIPCEMSSYQLGIYKTSIALDTTTDDELGVGNALYKNSNDASTMTYPQNYTGKDGFNLVFNKRGEIKSEFKDEITNHLQKYSSKLFNLLENIEKYEGTHFIYSNYVNFGGVNLVKNILTNKGYSEYSRSCNNIGKCFISYDDSKSIGSRERLRDIFNHSDNKNGDTIKILIGSPAVSEGITFKNIRNVHILEPFWNLSRINQIVGRAVRSHSHDDLPKENRFVKVFKYCSIGDDDSVFYIDKVKYILSEDKDINNKKIERLMKEVAFDCEYNVNRELKGKDNTPECDYSTCKYTCSAPKSPEIKNKDTYKMFLSFFENYDIQYVNGEIRNLFKEYFIWDLKTIIKKIRESINVKNAISDEVVYYCLDSFVENKNVLEDVYGREGYLIKRGDYFIFNPEGIDVQSSFYTKVINFKKYINKYDSVKNYIEKKKGLKIKGGQKGKGKGKDEVKSVKQEDETIDADILNYNKKLLSNKKNTILGTFRQRAIKGEEYGADDGKFRLIDLRKLDKVQDDLRKKVTGMNITSFKKQELVDIASYLSLGTKTELLELNTAGISNLIKNFLIKKNLVLR